MNAMPSPSVRFYEQLRYALGLEQGQVEDEHGDIIDALAEMSDTVTDDGFEVVSAPQGQSSGSDDGIADGFVAVNRADAVSAQQESFDDDIVVVNEGTGIVAALSLGSDTYSRNQQSPPADGGDASVLQSTNHSSQMSPPVSNADGIVLNDRTRVSPQQSTSVRTTIVVNAAQRGEVRRQHRTLVRSVVPTVRMTTPVGGATRSRDDSMQRTKAGRAARGSRLV